MIKRISKRLQTIKSKINNNQQYDIIEAITILKECSSKNFVESVDIAINLGIDPRKSDQNIIGSTILPYGSGRKVRIIVFSNKTNIDEIKTVGAYLVGMDDLAEKIINGFRSFDIVIASKDAMPIITKLSPILGPRGLMPNKKMGTITEDEDIKEAVIKIQSGQIFFRNDKYGIIHTMIGKINFESLKLKKNLEALLYSLKKNKPLSSKGIFLKQINLSTTMGVSLIIDQKSL